MLPPPMSVPPPSLPTTFRRAFVTGLLLIAPLVVTVWALLELIGLIGGVFGPWIAARAAELLPASVAASPAFGLVWDLLGAVIVVLLIALLGWVSRHFLAKYLLAAGDRLMGEIPGVSAVYGTVKQIVATFGEQGRNSFSKVVLVEFPRPGVWAVGFLTNTAPGEPATAAGTELWAVFVPTTPNPTSGFLIFVPRAEVRELEMSVADGMKLIISGGSITPPWPPGSKPPAPPAA
jgi:uncharacterized membrane protein